MKILLIGYGYWGKKIFAVFKQLNLLQISVYDIATNKESLDQFLNKIEPIDCVFIVTPAETHFALVKKFLLAGKHVFVEKPLCLNGKEATELVNLAKKKNKILFVDYIFLYDAHVQQIKKLLDQKNIGDIKKINIFRSSLVTNRPNILITDDLMIHDLYLIRYFFDLVSISKLNLVHYDECNLNFKQVAFSLTLNKTVQVSLFYTWICPQSKREWLLFSQDGTIFWQKNENLEKLLLFKNNKQIELTTEEKQNPLYESVADFFNLANQSSKSTNQLVIGDLNTKYEGYIKDTKMLELARKKVYEN